MAFFDIVQPGSKTAAPDERLLQNLKDYTSMSLTLLWQRQAIYLAATLLTAFYFDPINAALFYVTILFCEVQDIMLARRVAALLPRQTDAIYSSLIWILLNTMLSAAAICLFAISVAFEQESGGHFTPLFFLFAAALFAAMNNHQLVMALTIRLAMYGLSFFIIVLRDLWLHRPGLDSELWLHFFTVVFVMYFLIDCSIVFLKLYKKNLKQLEALREEHERTKAAYIVKSQFISTVSHELRTPLTSIKGSLDLLNSGTMGPVPDSMQKLVEIAGKNALRLSHLIDDVLDLQKIEAGEMNYKITVVEVKALLDEAVSGNSGYGNTYGVTITEDCPPDETMRIRADESRLIQVLNNMISNAMKFSPEGSEVTVGCKRFSDTVRIYVADQGSGIPEGVKHKVFDRFSQLDSSDQRRAAGSGLGMSISKEIVEQLGGTIDYVSELGRGTTFYCDFPACGDSDEQWLKGTFGSL